MSVLGIHPVHITRYIRSLRGGSQPILAQASDGRFYVVKFKNNLQGPNLLFNESIGSELYRSCKLPVPVWKPLLVTDSFLDQNPDCWMQTPEGSLRPDSGMCFGSSFMGGGSARLLEILPGTSFSRVRNIRDFWLAWLVDICARHSDHRQAVFQEDATGGLSAVFVDHGHNFGGPNGEHRVHFVTSRYLDPRIYQGVSSQQLSELPRVIGTVDVVGLWKKVHALPDDWRTSSALNNFAECLDRLSNAQLLHNVLETIVDNVLKTIVTALRRTNDGECFNSPGRRKPPTAVLRVGIQAAGCGDYRAASCECDSACA